MNLVPFLSVAIIVLLLLCCFMASKINSIKKQSLQILSVLDDIDTGNLGWRVVAHGEEVTDEITPKKWTADKSRLTTHKNVLYEKMKSMRESIKTVEQIRKKQSSFPRQKHHHERSNRNDRQKNAV